METIAHSTSNVHLSRWETHHISIGVEGNNYKSTSNVQLSRWKTLAYPTLNLPLERIKIYRIGQTAQIIH